MHKRPVMLVMALVAAASASAVAEGAVYEGHVKGAPGSAFGFTIAKEDGKREVTEAHWEDVPNTCDGTPSTTDGSSGFTSGARVRHGAFDARLDAGTNQNRVKGELKRGGKATGIFRNIFGMMTVCDTGRLEWTARK